MNILDRIINRFRPKAEEKVEPTGIFAVYDAPADYNRATRRRIGMLSKVWRWDIPANPFIPRYWRRHPGVASSVFEPTRRQRKQRRRAERMKEHYAV